MKIHSEIKFDDPKVFNSNKEVNEADIKRFSQSIRSFDIYYYVGDKSSFRRSLKSSSTLKAITTLRIITSSLNAMN